MILFEVSVSSTPKICQLKVSESLARIGHASLAAPVDVDGLEEGGGLALSSRKPKPTPKPASKPAEKKKKKRKTKIPPGADLSQPPDPERWLPKYERSTTRKKKDKRRDKEVRIFSWLFRMLSYNKLLRA